MNSTIKDGAWRVLKAKLTSYLDQLFSGRIKINAQLAIPFWIASLLVGLVAVGYTRLFTYAENLLHSILLWHSWMIFIVAPTGFLLAWLIVHLVAPNAKGSGFHKLWLPLNLPRRKIITRYLSY